MIRKDIIREIMVNITDEYVLTNIGVPSREVYWIKDRPKNFYMLGSMGLVSSIGLGLALSHPDKKFLVIDGDGSVLMNMGALATTGWNQPNNLVWIIIDNGAYGSTGFQPTFTGKNVDIAGLARECDIPNVFTVHKMEDIQPTLNKAFQAQTLSVVVIKAKTGPQIKKIIPLDAEHIKNRFMKALNE